MNKFDSRYLIIWVHDFECAVVVAKDRKKSQRGVLCTCGEPSEHFRAKAQRKVNTYIERMMYQARHPR